MQINILKSDKNEALIEFVGENNTFLNVLKSVLLQDEDLRMVTYDIKFSTSHPILCIKTTEKDPLAALKDAACNLVSQCDEFKQVFNEKTKSI